MAKIKSAKQLRIDYVRARAQFVRELARFLVEDQAAQSIRLEMGDPGAKAWARLRSACTPIGGYPTVEEAETLLAQWLGLDPLPKA